MLASAVITDVFIVGGIAGVSPLVCHQLLRGARSGGVVVGHDFWVLWSGSGILCVLSISSFVRPIFLLDIFKGVCDE